MRNARCLLRASALLLPALLARQATVAQLRLGAEFRVNSYTTNNQLYPAIASDPAGNFVVVWSSSGPDGSGYGIVGQRYASSGAPRGAEFQVNSYTTGSQFSGAIAADPAGNFVVVWRSRGQDGYDYGVFGQRYASSGAPRGAEFRVNSYTTFSQDYPAIASDSAGNFVVVWRGSFYGIFGQRYAGSGAPLGTEFQINSYTPSVKESPAIASDPAGNFVVVWQTIDHDGSLWGVFGQRYGSSGARIGTEFQVNSYTTNSQRDPAIASDSAGNFVVVWQSYLQDFSDYGIFGQRYAGSGARLGPEFRVNGFITSSQRSPAIASDPAGNFIVAWNSNQQDGANDGVFAQRYASSGSRVGAEFRVNSFTTYNQFRSAIASDPAGNFVVVWTSDQQDGSNGGVFGQRFCPDPLSAVSVMTAGPLSVCSTSTGGTASVTDTGGGTNLHQWVYRTTPMGASTPISGQTGASYLIKGADFGVPPGTPGLYYLYCLTTPSCGSQMFSPETIIITVSADGTPPSVTPPTSLTTRQSLCQ